MGNGKSEYDFVCNRLPPPWTRTYPIGLDVEACTFKVLKKAWKEAIAAYNERVEREGLPLARYRSFMKGR